LAKTYNSELELRVLRSAMKSARHLSVLRRSGGSSLFNLPAARKLYERADKILKTHGEMPSWRDLMTDPALPQDVRERASSVKAKPINKLKTLRQCSDRLAEFARIRVAFDAARDVGEYISNSEGIDPDVLSDMLAKAASKSRKVQDEEVYRHIGLGGKRPKRDGEMVLGDLLKNSKHSFVPSGFKSFDTRSVGLPRSALVSVAGQSGGGKSTLADTMRTNMALRGYRTNMWSLEQDHSELEMRLIARLTGINMEKFLKPKTLQKSEKDTIKEKYDEFIEQVLARGGFTSTAVPRGGITMMDILENDESFGYDVTFIDYISLLEDADSEEQWKALGNAARQGKINAQKNKKVIVILAQLSDDEKVRYARAVKEHCNNLWTWMYGDRERATHIVKITQQKARNQPVYDIILREEFEYNRFRDPTDDELREYERGQTNNSTQKSKISDYNRNKSK